MMHRDVKTKPKEISLAVRVVALALVLIWLIAAILYCVGGNLLVPKYIAMSSAIAITGGVITYAMSGLILYTARVSEFRVLQRRLLRITLSLCVVVFLLITSYEDLSTPHVYTIVNKIDGNVSMLFDNDALVIIRGQKIQGPAVHAYHWYGQFGSNISVTRDWTGRVHADIYGCKIEYARGRTLTIDGDTATPSGSTSILGDMTTEIAVYECSVD